MYAQLATILSALVLLAAPARSGEPDHAPRRHPMPVEALVEPAPLRAVAGPLVRGSAPQAEATLVGRVDGARYAEIVAELCGHQNFQLDGQTRQIQTRWAMDTTNPDGVNLARDYLADRFEAAGYTVQFQSFTNTDGGVTVTSTNLLAVRAGTTVPDEILVIGAHYDAIAQLDELDAPGAEDNASGTAAVLHLAELLAGFQPERTIHFVAFGGEEQGLKGSSHYVQESISGGTEIVAALTMDMIAAWVDDFGIWIESEAFTASMVDPVNALVALVEDNVDQWTTLPRTTHLNAFGSDHVPFLQAGIPAILAIDEDWDQYDPYHTTTDTFDKVDPALGTEITKVIAGCIADVAGVSRIVRIEDPTPSPTRPDLALLANVPNPFNPRTTLAFTLPTAGPTRLEIYDQRGRRVRSLVATSLGAGPHQRVWDGLDDGGRPVASGLYFSRLVHPEGTRSRRLTLVR